MNFQGLQCEEAAFGASMCFVWLELCRYYYLCASPPGSFWKVDLAVRMGPVVASLLLSFQNALFFRS